jgi:cell division protein FtsW (lipid II flippase)
MVSYGGTAMVTNLIGIALLMNVSMRRFMLSP